MKAPTLTFSKVERSSFYSATAAVLLGIYMTFAGFPCKFPKILVKEIDSEKFGDSSHRRVVVVAKVK